MSEVWHSTNCAKHPLAVNRRSTGIDSYYHCDCGAEVTSLRTRLAKAENMLALANHRLADDEGQEPYCLECEASWPCEAFKRSGKFVRNAVKQAEKRGE